MGNSKLTRRFQVTVPKDVRRLLRLDAGDLLVFMKSHDEVVVKRGKVRIEEDDN
jgi:AbrB family looped-hinge helix DNA binding protein